MHRGFPGGSVIKNPPAVQETQVPSLGWEDPLEKGMVTHSNFLPGKFYGQRSLVDYSPWGAKELDLTEQLSLSLFFFFFQLIAKIFPSQRI